MKSCESSGGEVMKKLFASFSPWIYSGNKSHAIKTAEFAVQATAGAIKMSPARPKNHFLSTSCGTIKRLRLAALNALTIALAVSLLFEASELWFAKYMF